MKLFSRNSAPKPGSYDDEILPQLSLAQPLYSPPKSLSLELYHQTLALYRKTILILWRSWMSTTFRAWTLPICYCIFMVSLELLICFCFSSNNSYRGTPNTFILQTLHMVLQLPLIFLNWRMRSEAN